MATRSAPLPVSGAQRIWVLGRLVAGMVALAFEGRRRVSAGEPPEEVREDVSHRQAAALRSTLGGLKGGAQKAAQFVSTVDSLLPADFADAVVDLQESGEPVDFRDLEPVVAAALGPRWRSRFRDFDERPAASASLGQVHRAIWEDGREVAVKIQYPGVDRAVRADLRGLGWALRAATLASPGMGAAPVARELQRRVSGELDYRAEARAQMRFAEAFRGDPDVYVPQVLGWSRRVLVSEWLNGERLVDVDSSVPAARRDRLGVLFQRFALSAPARVGLLHADPHPGNFRSLPDGRLGVLDFGAVVPMPGGLPAEFGHLIAAMRSDDADEVLRRLRAARLVRPGAELDVPALMDFLGPFSDPARHEVFAFTPEWLRSQFAREHNPRNPDYAVALHLTLPPDQLMTHRVWLGVVGVLCRLRATVPVLPELRRWLPGLED